MAKSCKRKYKRHHKTRRHRQSGGELGSNPPSSWGWGLGTLGDGLTQFTNSLSLQPGNNNNINQSNNIVPVGKAGFHNMNSKMGGRRKKYRGGNANALIPNENMNSMPMNSMPMNSMPMNSAVPVSVVPVSMPMSKTGGRARSGKSCGKSRGGNVLAQAIVPASLILMNNALGKYSRSRSRSRKSAQKRF